MNRYQIFSNSTHLFVVTASNLILGFAIVPVLTRVLSKESFGLAMFAMSFVFIFQVITEYGFTISGTAQIARARSDIGKISEIVSVITFARIILFLVSAAGFGVLAFSIPSISNNFLLFFLFFCSSSLAAFMPDFYFRGKQEMRSLALRAVLSRVIILVFILAFVRSDENLFSLPSAFVLGNIVSLFMAVLEIKREGTLIRAPKFQSVFDEIRQNFGFFVSRLTATANQQFPSIVLGLQFSPVSPVMGLFAGANRIASAGEQAIPPVADALYPYMVKNRDYSLFARVYVTGLVIWFVGCAVVFLLADFLVQVILGLQYADSAGVLRILLVGSFLAYSNVMLGYPALAPLNLSMHANMSVALSAAVMIAIFALLITTASITITTVSIVVVIGQAVGTTYRGTALLVGLRVQHRLN